MSTHDELPDYSLDSTDILSIFSKTKKPKPSPPKITISKQEKPQVKISKTKTKKRNLPKESTQMLQDFRDTVQIVKAEINSLKLFVEEHKDQLGKGLSYLALKNQLLMEYCTNLGFFMKRKVNGEGIQGHPVVEQLVKERLVLEKLRPIDLKLKYQIEKMITMANTGDVSKVDEKLKFRPNLDDFDDSEEISEDENNAFDKKYIVNKALGVQYDEGDAKESRQEERLNQRARRSSMAQMLRDKYGTAPEQEHFNEFYSSMKQKEKFVEETFTNYEEDNFVRLNRPKNMRRKTKKKVQEEQFYNALDDLESFSSIAALEKKGKKGSKLRQKLTDSDWRGDLDHSEGPQRKKRRKN